MSSEFQVLIYGGSGYTGKLVAESLAQRDIPFYLAGRNQERLEKALNVVKQRHDGEVNARLLLRTIPWVNLDHYLIKSRWLSMYQDRLCSWGGLL